jgi:hypothetical protein
MFISMLPKLPDNPVWTKLRKLLKSTSEFLNIYWKGWEEFNWYYEAIRTELFRVAKKTELDIKEFYSGADFSSVSNCLLKIEEASIIRADHKWPNNKEITCIESHVTLSESLHSKCPVVKCVDGAVCHIFHVFFVGKDRTKINEDFCYILGI